MSERRGIVLVSTLLTLLVLTMFVGATVALGPAWQSAESHLARHQAALAAANSGVQYARFRLRQSPGWRGDGEGLDGPDLQVREQDGVVTGKLPDAQFRLRFGSDEDPLPPCGNNLLGNAELPLGDEVVAPRSVLLRVEGRVGESRVLVTSVLHTTLAQPVAGAAVMAGGDQSYHTTRDTQVVVSSQAGTPPSLRARGEISVEPGRLQIHQGRLGTRNGLDSDLHARMVGSAELFQDRTDFYNIRWDDVRKADPHPASHTIHIPAGIYVHWGRSGELHYYDMSLADYKTMILAEPENPGVLVSSRRLAEVRSADDVAEMGNALNVTNGVWTVSQDMAVQPTAAASEFVVMPRKGYRINPDDASMDLAALNPVLAADRSELQGLKFRLRGATVSVEGDAVVAASVNSTASTITAGSSLTVNSHTFDLFTPIGRPSEEQGLNLYSRGPVTVSTYHYESGTGQFGHITLTGLFYSQSQVSFVAGWPSRPDSYWRPVHLRGALVAYGGDPNAGTPGSSGHVSVYCDGAILEWDSKVLGNLIPPSSPRLLLRQVCYAAR